MEAYNFSNSTLKFTLRNVGSASVTVASVYLGGNSLATGLTDVINIGGTKPYTYSPSGYTVGAAYTLKIVSSTGGVFTFSVINGSAG